jgi:hypothetical protein
VYNDAYMLELDNQACNLKKMRAISINLIPKIGQTEKVVVHGPKGAQSTPFEL